MSAIPARWLKMSLLLPASFANGLDGETHGGPLSLNVPAGLERRSIGRHLRVSHSRLVGLWARSQRGRDVLVEPAQVGILLVERVVGLDHEFSQDGRGMFPPKGDVFVFKTQSGPENVPGHNLTCDLMLRRPHFVQCIQREIMVTTVRNLESMGKGTQ